MPDFVYFGEAHTCVGPGWKNLIKSLDEMLQYLVQNAPNRQELQITVSDIKEKFGGLRISLHLENFSEQLAAEVWSSIDFAEIISMKVCEECGSFDAYPSNQGWIKTLCAVHHAQRSVPKVT